MQEPLVIDFELPLTRHEVWELCTTEAGLAQWWWPHLGDTTYEIDPRESHTFRFASTSAGIAVHGSYIVVEKYAALEFSWVWEDEGPPVSDHVRLSLTCSTDQRTVVRLTHTMSEPSPHGWSDYRQGWADAVDRLRQVADEQSRRAEDGTSFAHAPKKSDP